MEQFCNIRQLLLGQPEGGHSGVRYTGQDCLPDGLSFFVTHHTLRAQ
jgi:hypothetical protein